MSRKDDSDKLFHSLPPLPEFVEESTESVVSPPSLPVGSQNKSLDDLSLELESELHRSDLFRKEELDATSEGLGASELTSIESISTKIPVISQTQSKDPIVEQVTDDELVNIVDDEVIHHTKQFEAVDSGLVLEPETDSRTEVKKKLFDTLPDAPSAPVDLLKEVTDSDQMHKRQQDYFDTLRARLDHEMRERQQHVKNKEQMQHLRADELAKWESVLVKKEKHVATHKLEYAKIKSLQKKLDDNTISLKYEKSRVHELDAQLSAKSKSLNLFEKKLRVKENQLRELGKELVARGAVIEKHTASQLDHFTSEEAKLEKKFGLHLSNKHLKKPLALEYKPKSGPLKNHFSKPLSVRRSISLEKLQLRIFRCYEYLGRGDLSGVSAEYAGGAVAYREFAAEFGNDAAIHSELTKLYADILIQMRQ